MKIVMIDDCRKCPHSGDAGWRIPFCHHAQRTDEIKDEDYIYIPGPECSLPDHECKTILEQEILDRHFDEYPQRFEDAVYRRFIG